MMPEVVTEKKKILIVGLAVILVLGLLGAFFLSKKEQGKFISPLSKVSQEGKEGEILLWDDEAGFTFQYPEGLYIDSHPEDMENYAHLEITSTKETQGRILILVNGAQEGTIEEWVEKEKQASQASIIDTTLADVPAKKLLFKEPKKILTAAIDPYEGLFLLELYPGEGEFWQKVYNKIISSFTFKPLSQEEKEMFEETGGGEVGGNVIYEEEEVIE